MEIDLTTLGWLSSSTTAFIKQAENLTQLIPAQHPFFSLESAMKGKENFSRKNRQILTDTLRKSYQRLKIADNSFVNSNIESLQDAHTYTVTTGQQLHLFLGPAFMVYKLISTIKTAEYFQSLYPEKKFVPIYWLASEDHDFDEIKKTPLFGQDYVWETAQTGACGSFHLKDLPPLFEQLKHKLVNDSKALQMLGEFEAIYNSSENLSDATIRLTHHLFGQYGLVCLDANNHDLKSLFKTVIVSELTQRKSEMVFNDFSEKMTAKNLSLQLKSRPVNLFYMKDGMRARIEWQDGLYIIIGTDIRFTQESLLKEIEQFPEHFSPNALLRPVYQETILPNVAYIAGNAEINYWLQLMEVFDLYHTTPSKLVLRQSAWVVRQKQLDWLASKKITVKEMFDNKTGQDILNRITQSEAINPYASILLDYSKMKNEVMDLTAKDKIPLLNEISETGKAFEKSLKELIKKKNELLIEKNKKDIIHMEQLINNVFSTSKIQERSIYAIEFMINVKDYIIMCHNNILANQGIGYFLIA